MLKLNLLKTYSKLLLIKYWLNTCDKITGDYFLFDGSDSSSLMGAYEVFEQSNAKYLFNVLFGDK